MKKTYLFLVLLLSPGLALGQEVFDNLTMDKIKSDLSFYEKELTRIYDLQFDQDHKRMNQLETCSISNNEPLKPYYSEPLFYRVTLESFLRFPAPLLSSRWGGVVRIHDSKGRVLRIDSNGYVIRGGDKLETDFKTLRGFSIAAIKSGRPDILKKLQNHITSTPVSLSELIYYASPAEGVKNTAYSSISMQNTWEGFTIDWPNILGDQAWHEAVKLFGVPDKEALRAGFDLKGKYGHEYELSLHIFKFFSGQVSKEFKYEIFGITKHGKEGSEENSYLGIISIDKDGDKGGVFYIPAKSAYEPSYGFHRVLGFHKARRQLSVVKSQYSHGLNYLSYLSNYGAAYLRKQYGADIEVTSIYIDKTPGTLVNHELFKVFPIDDGSINYIPKTFSGMYEG